MLTDHLDRAQTAAGLGHRGPCRERIPMRLVVDLNRCQGFAQCVFLAPDVFALHGEEALLFSPRFDEAQRDRVEKAAAACPVQAILVDYSDEPTKRVEPHVG
ncbi:hypothetical protein GCM10009646_52160 [Streptomyces aureus]